MQHVDEVGAYSRKVVVILGECLQNFGEVADDGVQTGCAHELA